MSGNHSKSAPIAPDLAWKQGGYYSAPARGWLIGWEPSGGFGFSAVTLSQRATAARDKAIERGETGSIAGLSVRADAQCAVYKRNRKAAE